jgi:hypothetical protein
VVAARVIRSRPEDIGQLPDGDPPSDTDLPTMPGRRRETVYTAQDLTLKRAVSTPAFWLLTVAVTLRIACSDALVINQISLLVWKGVPKDQAAYYLSLTFLAIIPLRFGMGLAATVIPSRWLLVGGMTIGAAGTATVLWWSGNVAAALFVISLSSTEGIATLGWLAVGEYFGRRSFGTLTGIMTVSFGAGALVAPVAAGWVYVQTDTYATVLMVASPATDIGTVLFAGQTPRSHADAITAATLRTQHSGSRPPLQSRPAYLLPPPSGRGAGGEGAPPLTDPLRSW